MERTELENSRAQEAERKAAMAELARLEMRQAMAEEARRKFLR